MSWRCFILFYGWPSFHPNKHCWLRAGRNQWLLPCHNDKSQPSIGRFLIRCLLFFKTLLLVLLHKVWCDAFDNFFQTEGNGQDSAEFIDFRKQIENKCYLIQNYQTVSTFYDKIVSKNSHKEAAIWSGVHPRLVLGFLVWV